MSFATLTVGAGWLKNFDPLATEAQKGLTQDDVDKAEAYADTRIKTWALTVGYDPAAAAFATAPMIVETAEMFGSARMIEFKFSQNPENDVGLASALEEKAERLLELVRHTGLYAADGTRIWPTAVSMSRVGNPEECRR